MELGLATFAPKDDVDVRHQVFASIDVGSEGVEPSIRVGRGIRD